MCTMLAAMAALITLGACTADLPQAGPWRPLLPAGGELLQPEAAGGTETPDRLRVVSFNVELAPTPAALAAELGAYRSLRTADVLLLQEIEAHPAEAGSRAALLAGALGLGYAYAPSRSAGQGTHGLAILSRYPISDVEVMSLPKAPLLHRDVQRIAMAATIAGVRFINVHLDIELNLPERILQLRPAIIDAPPISVVAGDFNTNPYSWTGRLVPDLISAAIADADQARLLDDYLRESGWDTPTAGLGDTQNAGITRLRLDAIYTRELELGARGIETAVELSDHWPLWLDIQLAR